MRLLLALVEGGLALLQRHALLGRAHRKYAPQQLGAVLLRHGAVGVLLERAAPPPVARPSVNASTTTLSRGTRLALRLATTDEGVGQGSRAVHGILSPQ